MQQLAARVDTDAVVVVDERDLARARAGVEAGRMAGRMAGRPRPRRRWKVEDAGGGVRGRGRVGARVRVTEA